MELNANIEIINQAYSLIKNEYVFHRSTMYLQNAFWDGVSEKDYIEIDYKLKAIRQDFAKILVIMNTIDTTYSQYQQNEFIPSYFSGMDNQAKEELGCFIEYLFAKYRVLLEYIQQILEICIPPRLNDIQWKEYSKLEKKHKKYKFLLKYVADNIEKTSCFLNMEWFQNIRVERDFIIHAGATCLVFGDKENLLFKVMTTDALDKDDDALDKDDDALDKDDDALDKDDDEFNVFYSTKNGLIDYTRYWGLQISKLIIFVETIMGFLITISSISVNGKECTDLYLSQDRNRLIDSDGAVLRDKQDVLDEMLRKLINMEELS